MNTLGWDTVFSVRLKNVNEVLAKPVTARGVLSVDKTGLLTAFLGSLPGHIAARLARAVELDRLMDGKALPHEVSIHFVDERLSSKAAEESLGFKTPPRDREQKKLIDQVAAVAILQDYLNTRLGPEGWLLPEEE